MRNILWHYKVWDEYLSFKEDKATFKRLNKLIKDVP